MPTAGAGYGRAAHKDDVTPREPTSEQRNVASIEESGATKANTF